MTFLIGLFLLGGCSGQEPCDSSEFICDSAAFRDQRIQDLIDAALPPDSTEGTWIELIRVPGCLGDPDYFRVRVRVHGATDGASRVDIWESDEGQGFNESHGFTSEVIGTGEELLVELRDGATPSQYEPGLRTTYDCGTTDVGGLLTFVVRVYDPSGDLADCAIFSTEQSPDAAIASVFGEDAPEPNEVEDRNEIRRPNCRTWTLPPG